jgi:hypothetical protein
MGQSTSSEKEKKISQKQQWAEIFDIYGEEAHVIDTQPQWVVDSSIEYHYESLACPVDEEGYITTFEWTEKQKIRDFFQKYGLVVVRNLLTSEECSMTEDEVWKMMNNEWKFSHLKR